MKGFIFAFTMKMGTGQARAEIFQAMLKHNGNRALAAKELDISLRTFYRYLDEYEMHPILERCGWQHHAGPPRGQNQGAAIRRGIVMKHIRDGRGFVDYSKLTKDVYGEDLPITREKIFRLLDEMKRGGLVEFDGIDKWTVKR